MLYTLSLFALEGKRWVEKREWRGLNMLERAAVGTHWKSLGDAMEVEYTLLRSSEKGRWRDGLEWLEALEEWSLAYEQEHMVFAESNVRMAEETVGAALRRLPVVMQKVLRNVLAVLMGQRLRVAMGFAEPAMRYRVMIDVFTSVRRFVIRHLLLPRPCFLSRKWFAEHPDPVTGKFQAPRWRVLPYYVKPTFANRWGPGALLARLRGGVLPGDDGDKYYPEGYVISELGPEKFIGKGQKEMEEDIDKMERLGRSGCPFRMS